MKTKILALILPLYLSSCNLGWGGEDGPEGTIYDVKFCNNASYDLTIYTFNNGKVLDKIKIKSGGKKLFNNVTYPSKGVPKNIIFSRLDIIDSSLIVLDNVEIDSNKKYKKYILQYCPPIVNSTCYDSIPKWVLNYGRKNGGTEKDRKWYSLNKGSSLFTLTFENNDFTNQFKMYDFEKRGL